ncbi:MAG: preprotein translocase subunit SecE [Deltaproteobacteria bacterium]|nr:preprotein translocase subunit SecE [Deltaproteobacteria bacterium]
MNNARWVNISFVVLGVVAFLFMRQAADVAWTLLKLPVPSDWPVVPADLIGAAAGVAVFFVLKKNRKAGDFFNEVVAELAKVTWPPKKETLLSTAVIAIMVAICSMIIFGFDTLWGTVVKLLYQ